MAADFPNGPASSDAWQTIARVREEFFRDNAPQLCADNNPPAGTLLGVKKLALPEMIIEMDVMAVF